MTKTELDEALYRVRGFIPKILVGPGHSIRYFDGYGDPRPDYYRGVPVEVHAGWAERCEVLAMDDWPD